MNEPRRLRITHLVCTDAFAGTERSVVTSGRVLAGRGHQVTVIGGRAEVMQQQLAGSPIIWRPAHSVATGARALAQLGRVDIVHAHMTSAELAAVLSKPVHGGELVMTRHFGQHRGQSHAGGIAAGLIGRVRRTEVAISSFVAGQLEHPAPIVFHGLVTQEAVTTDGRTVVVIQRLEAEKRTDIAIRAWSTSGLGDEGWTLAIAGDGAQRASLEALARSEGVDRSIRFLGNVNDVDALRRTAALQLATPDREAFGLSVLEAMACGLPVIAAQGGAHPELIGDRPELLFPPDDPAQAGRLLRALAESPERRRSIGAELRDRQREWFSLDAHGAALELVYRKALQTKLHPSTWAERLRPHRIPSSR